MPHLPSSEQNVYRGLFTQDIPSWPENPDKFTNSLPFCQFPHCKANVLLFVYRQWTHGFQKSPKIIRKHQQKNYAAPKLETMQGRGSRDNTEKEIRLCCNLILNRFCTRGALQNLPETDSLNGPEEECEDECPDNALCFFHYILFLL